MNVKDDALELDTRRALYDIIANGPGRHFRAIQRESGLPSGVVDYHLRVMEQQDLIVSRDEGRYKRFYIVGKVGSKDKELMGLLRQKTPRKIVLFLMLNPRSKHKEIKNKVGVSASTMSYHLKKLKKKDVVKSERQGRSVAYWIDEEDRVARALIRYKRSFLDDAVDAFADTWLELHP